MSVSVGPNNQVLTLDVNGETHLDGWVFTFDGTPDESLFTITNNIVYIGNNYIENPGIKYLRIRATNGPDIVVTSYQLNLAGLGITNLSNSNYLIWSQVIPSFTSNDWELQFSVFMGNNTPGNSTKRIFTWAYNGQDNHISIDTFGIWDIIVATNSQYAQVGHNTTGTNRWMTIRVFGSGTNQMSVSVNGTTVLTNISRWPNTGGTHPRYIGHGDSVAPTWLTVTNIKFKMDGITYFSNTLSAAPTIPHLFQVGSPTYNSLGVESAY